MAKAKKITVAEWREFLNVDWAPGEYADDVSIEINGESIDSDLDLQADYYAVFDQSAIVQIVSGYISDGDGEYSRDLKSAFNTWRMMSAFEFITIRVERGEKAEAFKKLIADVGVFKIT